MSPLPSLAELGALLAYVLGNPHLFVGSSTVMTTGLVALATTLRAVDAVPRAFRARPAPRGQATTFLDWLAPKLALVLAYFGIGSMALATEILLRFHAALPVETELQFRSGLAHLAVALAGLAILFPWLRGRSRRDWLAANLWALGYWALHVAFLTPPWFSFGRQGDLALGVVKLALALGFAVTLLALRDEREAGS